MDEGSGDAEADYVAIRNDVGAIWLARDFVRAEGPDTLEFLQGQLSQDLAPLAVGDAALSWLLQPHGKVVALVRICRGGDDAFVLDTDAGFGPPVLERLQRFKLRVRCDLQPLPWTCLAVRGPKARQLDGDAGRVTLDADWPGLPGVDLVGEAPTVPTGVRVCAPAAWEAVRIEAGVPVMGRELDERTIPAETGADLVQRTVSFTKGCYTGQELVARIDSRGGHVPRRLLGLVLDANAPLPPAGAVLGVNGKDAGAVTSSAFSPGRRATVALAYVKRDVQAPADVVVTWDGGQATGRVETLPLVS